ncbi:hypothetical protein WJX79_005533 [Trebouxia sp. C0005]|nr:MAG: unc-50 protein [Trebouxia sp. A1-2]
MLPTHATPRRAPPRRSSSLLPTYLRRIIKPKQMDLEYTFWLMLQLCISPKTVYRHTSYHRQTKNQWARDDPAFVIVCAMLVACAALAYCVAFSSGLWHTLRNVASAVALDFLLVGFVICTTGWFLSNQFLKRKSQNSHNAEHHVEWMYAFDVHCNSYFPLFILLYVVQFLFSPVLLHRNMLSTIISVALYVVALSYYHYLNFLGYSALPFLDHTEVFLWPIGGVVMVALFAVLTNFNPTRFTLSIYFS